MNPISFVKLFLLAVIAIKLAEAGGNGSERSSLSIFSTAELPPSSVPPSSGPSSASEIPSEDIQEEAALETIDLDPIIPANKKMPIYI